MYRITTANARVTLSTSYWNTTNLFATPTYEKINSREEDTTRDRTLGETAAELQRTGSEQKEEKKQQGASH